ncbi:MAG TPA: shikimate kinase [Gemmatimonadaceae bacterium]|jgi:shikimate kinase
MATFHTLQPGSAADSSLPHLVLVGLPGSGKSTVGAALAERLGRGFLDFDVEITRREGMTVPEIFAQRGEAHFRSLERALTEECGMLGSLVLAPGGGWVTQPENLSLLRPPARLIYLKATPETAAVRLGGAAAGRPLLNRPDPRGELARLLAARASLYESADVVVNVDHLDVQRVVDKVARLL